MSATMRERTSAFDWSAPELEEFLESANVAMHWVGSDGTILWANRAETEMMGYVRQEYVGRNIVDFHAERKVIEDILARLHRDEKLENYEATLVRKDGSQRHVLINSSVRWQDGRFLHTQCFTRDITERKQAEERLQRELAATRRLQETSVQLLEHDDPATIYGQICDAAAGIMGSQFASMQMLYPGRGPKGELLLLAMRGFDPASAKFWEWVRADSHCTCGEALRTGRRVVVQDVGTEPFMAGTEDQRALLAAGIRAAQSTPLVARDGSLLGMITTHWSRPHLPADHELRLMDVLARQAADLIERSKAMQSLREADRRKDEFLAVLSHELRNPLAPIRNAVTLLREVDADPAIRHQMRAVLDRQVSHLIRLVDDLLDVARIGRGDIGLQKRIVPLAEVLAAAMETSRPRVETSGHVLTLDFPDRTLNLLADPVRVAQVVSNLLNNASAYTPQGGRIDVSVRVTGKWVSIVVRDNGVGIAAEGLPSLFTMFSRGDVAKQHPTGFGIGLGLSYKLVEMHGGSIEASSDGLGKGATFTVRLPLAAQAIEPRELPPAAPFAPRRILVVDDNRDAADSLCSVLKVMGAEVQVARDGASALEEFRVHDPAVVILDIGMPGMDGYDVAREIRVRYPERTPRLIALTGWGQEEDRQRAREAGFDHHLVKPAGIEALQEILASIGRSA